MKHDMLQRARDAAGLAYSPYSNFRVGAAVAAGGEVYTGCNVENASYGLALCAERNAIFTAIAAGHRKITCVAVACIDGGAASALMPCGACLQVIAEFAEPETSILVDRAGEFTLAQLLPLGFRLPK